MFWLVDHLARVSHTCDVQWVNVCHTSPAAHQRRGHKPEGARKARCISCKSVFTSLVQFFQILLRFKFWSWMYIRMLKYTDTTALLTIWVLNSKMNPFNRCSSRCKYEIRTTARQSKRILPWSPSPVSLPQFRLGRGWGLGDHDGWSRKHVRIKTVIDWPWTLVMVQWDICWEIWLSNAFYSFLSLIGVRDSISLTQSWCYLVHERGFFCKFNPVRCC